MRLHNDSLTTGAVVRAKPLQILGHLYKSSSLQTLSIAYLGTKQTLSITNSAHMSFSCIFISINTCNWSSRTYPSYNTQPDEHINQEN